ncbi:TIGR02678 family protein [Caldanaerobius fijiensis DSM 17918]|uniref:TIGR02678 family protein n=1 Tax=Caldanaerobius fijiensis DSM 17918 TaxID=1121256 RepID=A0A1M4Y7I3_9THEO|nr:TIGR02678 family protein [Caldanaerobius fijiensis]SHF01767.1 TIGR02678 family protein [Caldanaerobius fijiensis DSM 17918]
MEEVKILLENFWITRDDKDTFNRIRDNEPAIRAFVEEKLGYRLIVNPYLIKLEKIPAEPEEWMGIQTFQSPMDYAFFCLLLAFLEDKGPEDQFVLSNVTEYIETQYQGPEKVDWTLFQQRKSLVRVLNFAVEMGMIVVDDGSHERFSDNRETEVLYENTGLSRYFMRSLNKDINEDISIQELLDEERENARRHKAYRKLILSPAVYSNGPDDDVFNYIKNYRNTIEKDVEENLDARLHIHKTSAFLIFNDNKYMKAYLPDKNSNISDIVLQICSIIREKVEAGQLNVNSDDSITLTETEFYGIIEAVKEKFSQGWYKSYREKSINQLSNEIIEEMQLWKMIMWDEKLHSFTILPIAAKLIGEYPEDFDKGEDYDE